MHALFSVSVTTCRSATQDIQCITIRQAIYVRKASVDNDEEMTNRLRLCKIVEEIEDACNDVVVNNEVMWYDCLRSVTHEIAKTVAEQNACVKEILGKIDCKLLGYASRNVIWGCGYRHDEMHALTIKDWKGMNLLGDAWMRVRDSISRARQHNKQSM